MFALKAMENKKVSQKSWNNSPPGFIQLKTTNTAKHFFLQSFGFKYEKPEQWKKIIF